MKKKLLLLLSMILMLSGCVQSNDDVQAYLDTTIETCINNPSPGPNDRKTLFAYYAEPSVGRIKTNQTSSLLEFNGISFVMNLNISHLIRNEYYGDANKTNITLNESLKVAGNNGTYLDYENNEHQYECNVYLIDSGYFIEFISEYVTFYASGNKTQIMNVLPEMVKISKSISIEQDRIIATYSSKETIEYTKETLELFQVVIPENGRVDEMIETVNGNNIIVDDNNTPINGDNTNEINNDNYQTDNYGTEPEPTPDGEYETEPEIAPEPTE